MRTLDCNPVPEDDRILTDEEIKAAILRATERMRGYADIGEFQLAEVCEHARDRMLDALSARAQPSVSEAPAVVAVASSTDTLPLPATST